MMLMGEPTRCLIPAGDPGDATKSAPSASPTNHIRNAANGKPLSRRSIDALAQHVSAVSSALPASAAPTGSASAARRSIARRNSHSSACASKPPCPAQSIKTLRHDDSRSPQRYAQNAAASSARVSFSFPPPSARRKMERSAGLASSSARGGAPAAAPTPAMNVANVMAADACGPRINASTKPSSGTSSTPSARSGDGGGACGCGIRRAAAARCSADAARRSYARIVRVRTRAEASRCALRIILHPSGMITHFFLKKSFFD